jgi:alanyl-tRNA synthetase
MLTGNEIRKGFLKFFADRGHKAVASSSLVPLDDPTLLFTNAGMNQFKNIFLGKEVRDYKRAASAQKCLRASGKHNDLEDVGKDTYHQTFFEMLGNWSFGDYYKKEAIDYAWELLTSVWSLPKDRLWATVYVDDDEAEGMWKKVTDISPSRVLRFGKKDNFWEMGETGPCGPCSEIHIDLGPNQGCLRGDCGPNCPHCGKLSSPRFMELWNLVFIQFDRKPGGGLETLPQKHVDTGMGFERMVRILRGTDSNYDIDVFAPILSGIESIVKKSYRSSAPDEQVAFRVIADHIRGLSFAIADGAIPSNEGRGYVLRRILRRAVRYGRVLGMHESFIHRLVAKVAEAMGEAYPEVEEKMDHVSAVIKSEEENFSRTLDRGIEKFEEVVREVERGGGKVISGSDAFRLYDTYGFPLDLTQLMAGEKGLSVDVAGFEEEMEKQRSRARQAATFVMAGEDGGLKEEAALEGASYESHFVGYEAYEAEGTVLKMALMEDDRVKLVLDRTPFYAESGGQVGDVGTIASGRVEIRVEDTQRDASGLIEHIGRFATGSFSDLKPGDKVIARVDVEVRKAAAQNHTATHLLHWALRQVLGRHVQQSGSLVAPDRLRFDFSHFAPISAGDLAKMEDMINERIRANCSVVYSFHSLTEAKKMGAMALFGEKYGEVVRVVKILGDGEGPTSIELCGGTHVGATGEIGLFKLVSESGIAAGVRRIEALTGLGALSYVRSGEDSLKSIVAALKSSPSDVAGAVERLLATIRDQEKEISSLKVKAAISQVESLIGKAVEIDGAKVVAGRLEGADKDALSAAIEKIIKRIGSGVVVLGSAADGKVTLVAAATDDLVERRVHAGNIVKEIAKTVDGGGGGKPSYAQAGGKNPAKLDEALARVEELVKAQLSGAKER